MTPDKMQELLARARIAQSKHQQKAADDLAAMLESGEVQNVDLTKAGVTEASLETDSGQDAAVDVIRDVLDTLSSEQRISGELSALRNIVQAKQHGVTRDVTLNEQQQLALETVLEGSDCCIIGAAGTGKTTSMRTITRSLLDATGRLPNLSEGTKYLVQGKPGAVICSYTRKAVNNIRHAVQEELKAHTITLHKLLEFAPVLYEIEDPADPGSFKKTMRFEPKRNAANPLPYELELIVYEEASMIGTDLYSALQEALPHAHQEVFLGDIQQLPPIFGSAVLGYKLVTLKTIELTKVYRQALENPILAMAWTILRGETEKFASKPVETYIVNNGKKDISRKRWPVLEAWNQKAFNEQGEFAGELRFQPWQKKLTSEDALNICGAQFCKWVDEGYYNPDDDMILLPFNKAFGTVELNKKIMQKLGDDREAVVHEVIAGFNRYYLAVGDRVLYDKEDAFITGISKNAEYLGKSPAVPSRYLDRWGCMQQAPSEAEVADALAEDSVELDDAALDRLMSQAADDETRVTVASHDIIIRFAYSDEETVLSKAAEVNNLLGGYAITVHKAQGSEYDRGFFVMHHTHAVMNQRELLYTAPTRFKKFLHVICEPDTFEKGIKSQRIEGDTLQEKAEFFKGKHKEGGDEAMAAIKSGTKYRVRDVIGRNDSVADARCLSVADKLSPGMSLQEVKQIIREQEQKQKEADMTRFSPMNATGRNEKHFPDEEIDGDRDTNPFEGGSDSKQAVADLQSAGTSVDSSGSSGTVHKAAVGTKSVQVEAITDPIARMRALLDRARSAGTRG